MLSRCALLAFAATVAPLVAAHGHMSGVFIDDVYVPGPQPNSGPGDFAIRQINDIDPVKGASNADLFCGHGSTPATQTVNATQGSVLKFAWNNGDNGPWVHNTGPVMTYMASCGAGGCANFNDPNAEFFKISELGRKDDGTWTMADLNSALNATTSATIPSFLPDGEYLVRHELIAMQLAMTEGGVEFYPACLQVSLSSGSSNTQSTAALPSGNNVVNFPGGYHDDDPGLWDPNVYNGETAAEYTFPGPPLITASTDPSGSSSSTDVPANTSENPSSTSDTPAPTATGCGNMSKKKKRVVKRIVRQGSLVKKSHKRYVNQGPNVANLKREANQPVARSRVMRGI